MIRFCSSGGVYANASNDDAPYNNNYSLTSFYNNNANSVSGAAATRKPFSAAVKLIPATRGVRLSGFSIVVGYSGSMGGYNSAPNPPSLGTDSWDVGLYFDNAQDCVCEDMTVLGYWRIAGHFGRISKYSGEFSDAGGYERNKFVRCWFQGQVSVLIRGGDAWPITSVGADWLEVPWADNHPFDLSISSSINVSGNPASLTINKSFTGLSKIGDKLRITGVSTSGIVAGWYVGFAVQGSGCSDAEFSNCYITGLRHATSARSTDASLQLPPSKGVEVSGASIRGLRFPGTKIQMQDEVAVMLHAANETVFGPLSQFEGVAASDGTIGMRFLASPPGGRTTYTGANTYRLTVDSIQNGNIDFTPEYGTQPPRFNDGGYYVPNLDRVSAFTDPLGYLGSRNFLADGQTWQVSKEGAWKNAVNRGILSAVLNGSAIQITDYRNLVIDVPSEGLLQINLSGQISGGLIYVGTNSVSGPRGLFYIRATATSPTCVSLIDANAPALSTADLAVTPGALGKLTISSSSYKFQVNNRLGSSYMIFFSILSA